MTPLSSKMGMYQKRDNSMKLLLKDGQIAAERFVRGDLLIENERIAKIGTNLSAQGCSEVIDCRDLLILPGLIDTHVHFREPGMESKGTIGTESRAAVLGGVTSYLEMPNTNPPATTLEAVERKKELASSQSYANYAFLLGADHNNLEEIKKADPKKIPALKVYMGSTTGSLLVDEAKELEKIFEASPLMIMTHCEDSAIINKALQRAKEQYGDEIPYCMHPLIRSADACLASTKLACELAFSTNQRLHIAHLSTKEEVQLLSSLKRHTDKITGEACLPHLLFSECDYERLGAFLKCNPAVKREIDRKALVGAVKSGVISTVATDHAPHELKAKLGSYVRTASGVQSVQYLLQGLLSLWQRKELTLEELIRSVTKNPAALFNIKERGAIAEGYYADLALVNLCLPHAVTLDDIASLNKWSPFVGHVFTASVVHTIVNGTIAVKDGKLVQKPCAMPLEFADRR